MKKRRPRHTRPREPHTFAQFLRQLPAPLRPLAQHARAAPPPCLLCAAPGTAIGAFVPMPPQQWGVPVGWMAGRIYTLCRQCLVKPESRAQVEAALWAERAVLAAPWN